MLLVLAEEKKTVMCAIKYLQLDSVVAVFGVLSLKFGKTFLIITVEGKDFIQICFI